MFLGTGNLEEIPDFAAGGYRLGFDSECIDAGNTTTINPIKDTYDLDRDEIVIEVIPDLDAAERRSGFSVDMGSYEFQCTGICTADTTGPDTDGCNHVPDGNVDSLDRLLLIAQWGSPSRCECAVAEQAQAQGPGSGGSDGSEPLLHRLTAADWDVLIADAQSVVESRQASGICWILHYLTECSDECAFEGCGSDDPLDGR